MRIPRMRVLREVHLISDHSALHSGKFRCCVKPSKSIFRGCYVGDLLGWEWYRSCSTHGIRRVYIAMAISQRYMHIMCPELGPLIPTAIPLTQ